MADQGKRAGQVTEPVIGKTEDRYNGRNGRRLISRRSGSALDAVTAEPVARIAARLERIGVPRGLAPTVKAGKFGEVLTKIREPTVALAFERTINQNDLLPVNFLERGYRASRCVGRIQIRQHGRTIGHGTGFLISPRLILTNNHVLGSPQLAAASRIEFDYEVDIEGNHKTSRFFSLDPRVFFETSPEDELDYTVVAVAERDGSTADLGHLRLIGSEGKVLLGEFVNIIQHPDALPKQLANRENRIVDVLDDFVHYETDTAPGSSGAPVLNDQWDLVALHHSGVPARDAQRRILARDGRVWTPDMGENQIKWTSNEGVRVSRIVSDLLRRVGNDVSKRRLLQQATVELSQASKAGPPGSSSSPPVVSGSPVNKHDCGFRGSTSTDASVGDHTTPSLNADGTATWTIPVRISVSLGSPPPASGRSEPDHGGTGAGPNRGPPGNNFGRSTTVSRDDGELASALDELEDAKERPYYDEKADADARQDYYADVDPNLGPDEFYDALSELVTKTHRHELMYKPSKHVYPVVDLHPDGKLRSIYSKAEMDPAETIRQDIETERKREAFEREFRKRADTLSAAASTEELAQLESAAPYNCEHVVPQSWFGKREPMRGDLHHLFACEPGCNSFRGNIPYYDFADFEEVIRGDCGKRETGKFEPSANKGVVARAVLYFLLRYRGEIDETSGEYTAERIKVLLDWHHANPVSTYEQHRNAEIQKKQGNRNPLIDHPDWAEKIAFFIGLGDGDG